MDERLKRTVERVTAWDDLPQLEINIRQRGGFTDEVAAAIKARWDEFGVEYVAQQTGIQLGDLSPAEYKIVRAIAEYVAIKKRQGSNAGRTLQQVRNRGLIDAAEASVSKAKPTQGYQALLDADLEDLSYERIVVDHADEFSARALWYARRTLGEPNDSTKPPALTHSNVQTRTESLLQWLKSRALANGGRLRAFTNAEAASAIGLGSLREYGRVHGNIQSRLDFACYKADLPPLGCAAVATFERAWAQDDRLWSFPVTDLQKAAQGRQWSADDFDRILAASETLPGIAHLPWREALSKDEWRVRGWAERWAREGRRISASDAEAGAVDRLPVDVLHKVTPEHIWAAVQQFMDGDVAHRFGPSRDFDLIADDGSRHAPKAVFGTALSIALEGRQIEPGHFSGGEGSTCLRLLRAANYLVLPKGETSGESQGQTADDQEWDEGGVTLRPHRQRERGRGLAPAKKAQYRRLHGKLSCQRCGMDPVRVYGVEHAESCIEVHHAATTIGQMEPGHKTKLEDLECLCASCHRLVHRLMLSAVPETAVVWPNHGSSGAD